MIQLVFINVFVSVLDGGRVSVLIKEYYLRMVVIFGMVSFSSLQLSILDLRGLGVKGNPETNSIQQSKFEFDDPEENGGRLTF